MAAPSNHRHLIIAGAPKSGSTSLFMYLQDHPEVCGCAFKEPHYFTNSAYRFAADPIKQLRKKSPLDIADYYNLFPCREHPVLCEASVSYMMSVGTPQRIRQMLDTVKIVFMLRNPVERFYSHYRHHIKSHLIPSDMTLDGYYRCQFRDAEYVYTDLARHALLVGCYSMWLERYYEVFPYEDILVLSFREFRQSPQKTVQKICDFVGIDPRYYENYRFNVFNEGRVYRHKHIDAAYKKAMWWLNTRMSSKFPRLSKQLHRINRATLLPLYNTLNTRTPTTDGIPPHIRAELEDYYQGEETALARLTGQQHLLSE